MILRSQLRMNKNILFPFVSCILIMLTLLVLIHKSADELNTVKKELVLCKQKHELASTQLQNAIDYKLRLEQSLENEKTKDKEHVDEMQSKLDLEEKERRKEREDFKKEKEDVNTRYENLKRELESLKTENQELKDENSKLNTRLDQVQSEKDKEVENLKDKIKMLENMQLPSQKFIPGDNKPVAVVERVDLVQSGSKGSTTPGINPQALLDHEESKQVAPPPNNGHAAQDKMRKSLDMRSRDDMKMDENVIKAPSFKSDDKKDQFMEDVKKDSEHEFNNDKQMNLPLPYVNNGVKQKASSASNNVGDHPVEDQGDKVAVPALHPPGEEKEKLPAEIPNQLNNYQNDEEEEEYAEKNEIPVALKKNA